MTLHETLIRVNRALFAYQIYVEAEATPGIEFLLRNAKESRAAAPDTGEASARSGFERLGVL